MANDQILDVINIGAMLSDFSDFTFMDFVVEIKDLRDALEAEKKAHAVDEFARRKAEAELERLTTLINNAVTILVDNEEKKV